MLRHAFLGVSCHTRCCDQPFLPRCQLTISFSPLQHTTRQVCHELPAAASQAIFKEAFRVLRPGGALAVMVSPAAY